MLTVGRTIPLSAVFIRAIQDGLDRDTVSGLVGHWRQALHAGRVTFTHPRTGAAKTLSAPVADDMLELARGFSIAVDDVHP